MSYSEFSPQLSLGNSSHCLRSPPNLTVTKQESVASVTQSISAEGPRYLQGPREGLFHLRTGNLGGE